MINKTTDLTTKKTVVIGASPNVERFSNKAVKLLREFEIPVVAVGFRPGSIGDVEIETGRPRVKNVHTVALYLGPAKQQILYDYILDLKPKRIIFNPGTENPELMEMADEQGIEIVENCLLVMLRSHLF
ncbi:MAG: CoA-binding protein [Chlorobi bacterium]|nr:CoA-binding protein [Chlorobiota bacterium]